MDFAPGQRVDGYELIEPIGAGGFSVVWKARRLRDGQPFALKFPLIDEFLAHLRAEAWLAQEHELPAAVVPLLEIRLDRTPAYLRMPWIDGASLAIPRRRAQPHEIVEALARVLELASIASELHQRGVVHGDLKPHNVLVDLDGRCRLLDLGLARVQVRTRQQRSLAQSLVSVAGVSIAGTLEYMAPEVQAGGAPGPPADVYSLGVILHQLLTGRSPAFGVDPRELAPSLPPTIDRLFQRMLHHDPRQRFADAGDLAAVLADYLVAERRCLARWHGHQRRAVRAARLATLRRGLGALGWVAGVLAVLWLVPQLIGVRWMGDALVPCCRATG